MVWCEQRVVCSVQCAGNYWLANHKKICKESEKVCIYALQKSEKGRAILGFSLPYFASGSKHANRRTGKVSMTVTGVVDLMHQPKPIQG